MKHDAISNHERCAIIEHLSNHACWSGTRLGFPVKIVRFQKHGNRARAADSMGRRTRPAQVRSRFQGHGGRRYRRHKRVYPITRQDVPEKHRTPPPSLFGTEGRI